ncbi:hypothetical protein PR048_018488 [Dryococelus australis]|uniref:DUF4371 domain-containing protein n=1 Tax=Dryococelus australis TaxID=614101 RepID=A0ABQ9HCD3_9NEOP|nr:hypothetical protein PR048_018488 [Dryococelus australis]
MAHSILRGLLSEIRNRKEFSIILDKTRDESRKRTDPKKYFWVYMKHLISQERDCFLLLKMFFVVSTSHFKISENNVMMVGATCLVLSKDSKPLCPTCWIVRVKSITSVINSYPMILQFLQSLTESNECVASKALGLYNLFSKGELSLGLQICLELFSATECLSVVLQKKQGKRNEDGFNHLWFEMDSKVVEDELIFPTLPRNSKKMPKRLQQSNYAAPSY